MRPTNRTSRRAARAAAVDLSSHRLVIRIGIALAVLVSIVAGLLRAAA